MSGISELEYKKGQMQILLTILNEGPKNQTDLRYELQLSSHSVVTSLRKLEDLGWLETQEIDKGPGRFNAIEYSLTPAGKEIAELLVPVDEKIKELIGRQDGVRP